MSGNSVPHEGKEKYIHRIFSEIAPEYELINHLLSFNLDRFWRRRAIAKFYRSSHKDVLDVCCGTGELTEILHNKAGKDGNVRGVDFCENMLEIARKRHLGIENIQYETGNIQKLRFPDGSFDAVYNCFALRNLSDMPGAIREMRRVTKPGGQVVIIDLTMPDSLLVYWYLTHAVPFIGRLCYGNEGPYSYLSASIRYFCRPEELHDRLVREGYTNVEYIKYLGGVVTAVSGTV
jgi:demethylmenaquinone methyltransferase/2-methoxy-6-polyprenyl-1,4-benzoquinol methylase